MVLGALWHGRAQLPAHTRASRLGCGAFRPTTRIGAPRPDPPTPFELRPVGLHAESVRVAGEMREVALAEIGSDACRCGAYDPRHECPQLGGEMKEKSEYDVMAFLDAERIQVHELAETR